jgi:hypothetical protein
MRGRRGNNAPSVARIRIPVTPPPWCHWLRPFAASAITQQPPESHSSILNPKSSIKTTPPKPKESEGLQATSISGQVCRPGRASSVELSLRGGTSCRIYFGYCIAPATGEAKKVPPQKVPRNSKVCRVDSPVCPSMKRTESPFHRPEARPTPKRPESAPEKVPHPKPRQERPHPANLSIPLRKNIFTKELQPKTRISTYSQFRPPPTNPRKPAPAHNPPTTTLPGGDLQRRNRILILPCECVAEPWCRRVMGHAQVYSGIESDIFAL